MWELPRGFFLGELLSKGAVGEMEINRVIAQLHRFYDSENPTAEIEEWGRQSKMKISTDENFEQVQAFVGKTISTVAFEVIRAFTNNFYVANTWLFEERMAKERIRDCHGDLHLNHIHITPDAVTIFDCIEFSDRLRFIDIANDLGLSCDGFRLRKSTPAGSHCFFATPRAT